MLSSEVPLQKQRIKNTWKSIILYKTLGRIFELRIGKLSIFFQTSYFNVLKYNFCGISEKNVLACQLSYCKPKLCTNGWPKTAYLHGSSINVKYISQSQTSIVLFIIYS